MLCCFLVFLNFLILMCTCAGAAHGNGTDTDARVSEKHLRIPAKGLHQAPHLRLCLRPPTTERPSAHCMAGSHLGTRRFQNPGQCRSSSPGGTHGWPHGGISDSNGRRCDQSGHLFCGGILWCCPQRCSSGVHPQPPSHPPCVQVFLCCWRC